ncbi:MAG: type II toxin-antitoxin system RelB family antitoxin [Acetobacteraceae bacterium]
MVSEFATTEEAEAHDRRFRIKVRGSLADARSGMPHDEAMTTARIGLGRKEDRGVIHRPM